MASALARLFAKQVFVAEDGHAPKSDYLQISGIDEGKTGRGGRTRTRDRRFWRPLLYQLSYTPALVYQVPLVRVERTTRGLGNRCSIL